MTRSRFATLMVLVLLFTINCKWTSGANFAAAQVEDRERAPARWFPWKWFRPQHKVQIALPG